MEYAIQQKINKLSKTYNYFDSKTAIKILSSISEEEKQIVLSDSIVQQTILRIDDANVLRTIFKKSPAFFQELMFSNEKVQDIIIAPKKFLQRKELFENYNKKDYVFSEDNLRQLEVFLHTIKSPKIYEQLVESKFFQRIIALCSENQLKQSFFKGIDEVKLFYNIINDDDIFKTRAPRRKNIIKIFNNVSDHILLSDDYAKIIDNPKDFIKNKRWSSRKFKKVYIDKRTLSLFSTEMIEELLEFENIDDEFVKEFLKNDIVRIIEENNYNFNRIFAHLLNGDFNCFNSIDFIYFNGIIEECEKDEIIKKEFIDFIYGILCNTQDLAKKDISIIKDVLYKKISSNTISKSEYKKLFYSPDSLKTIFYLKFGKTSGRMDYLNGISSKQIMYLNIKHLNQILKLLDLKNEDEISNTYSYAIKLYLTFGLERTLKILTGDYGSLNKFFFDNVSALNVSNVSLVKEGNKYIPSVSSKFINFMFSNQKNNHFIDMLNNPASELNKYWSYLYNNFDELKEKCHNVITLKQINIILKQLSPTRDISDVTPDNYKLSENDILNDVCLGNKTKKSNEEVYKMLLDIYEQMKKRTESSIPYIKSKAANGYSYEMMKLNDPIAFTLGYRSDCCIRTNDIAHNHLLHATLCRNGRILLIYDKLHKLAGFVPLKRNGEVLIANSIECLDKIKNEKAIESFSEAIKDIVLASQSNHDEISPISLVCIGTEAYARPNGTPFPEDIQMPTIYEKDDPIYKNTDIYHRNLTIIYQNPKLDLHNIKYGNPKCSYLDPRNSISSCDFRNSSEPEKEVALKIINAVRYANSDLEDLENFRLCRKYGLNQCIYNDDWYILTTSNGNIYGEYLKYDERAEKEYNIALNEFRKQFEKGQQSKEPKLVKRLK